VLFNFLAFHTSNSKLTVREAANITVDNIIPFYEKARVPHLAPNKMAEEVIKIYEDMRSIMKIDHSQRSTETKQKRINDFKERLEKTSKLWPRNALDRMKIEKDKKFLQSMMTDRVASMGQVDKVLSTTEDKVAKRKEAELVRLEMEKKRIDRERKVSSESLFIEGESSGVNYDSDPGDLTPTVDMAPPKRSHKRTVVTGTSGFWTPHILKSPAVVATAVRNNVTPTALAVLTHSLISATGGDPSKVYLNYSTV